MKIEVLNLVSSVINFSGVSRFYLRCCAKRKITIVNYHDPALEVFARHLEKFRKYFSFISMDDVEKALNRKDFSGLPDYPLVITFDDGHVNNYRLLPLLREYRVPAVIYVTAGLTGTARHFWWKEMRAHGLNAKIEAMKKLPSAVFRKQVKDLCGYEFEREYSDRQALNWEELQEFQKAGITIGGHSVNHSILNRCTQDEIVWECKECKRMLETGLGCEVRHFALPNGDGNEFVLATLKQAGYYTNRSCATGWNDGDTPLFQLRNFGIADTAEPEYALLQATGIRSLLKCNFWR